LDVAAGLEHFAGDFMAQDQAGRGGGAAAHHVLVGAADIGGKNLEDDAVIGLFAPGVDQFGKGNGLDFDLAWLDVSHTSVTSHDCSFTLVVGKARAYPRDAVVMTAGRRHYVR